MRIVKFQYTQFESSTRYYLQMPGFSLILFFSSSQQLNQSLKDKLEVKIEIPRRNSTFNANKFQFQLFANSYTI